MHGMQRAQLLEIVETLNGAGFVLGLAQYRHQQRRQNPDDGDDHEQLNQSECAAGVHAHYDTINVAFVSKCFHQFMSAQAGNRTNYFQLFLANGTILPVGLQRT